MRQRCPTCKVTFEALDDRAMVCARCGNAVVELDGRLRLMTVKEFVQLERAVQTVITRVIRRAAADVD